METANRTLTADVIATLAYWPAIIIGVKRILRTRCISPSYFIHDQLLGSHAKMGDVVLRPANAPAG
ncbi:hypothetical protein SAMN04489713_102233 [Actinomadura madurae]|uniref:Uncharacterized protein n=1 Tax=Actinomadura madurae TaxID=1993 RepID=A0A1I4ZKS1_9ACTN|nr:hypothetical protein [Actinomadura madurae]SFN50559.1 hypothetical protein SAMN04489713_102233 [Actinomadura madurae]